MPRQPKIEEEYTGQQREIEIHDAICKAVEAADHIILEASDGTVEETDYLTLRVAETFLGKLGNSVRASYSKKKLLERLDK